MNLSDLDEIETTYSPFFIKQIYHLLYKIDIF